MKTDGLSIISSSSIISAEKIKDKTLDQMTLPERADLLKEAYSHVEGDENVTDDEMEVIGMLSTALDDKIASWGLVIRKVNDAAEVCKIEADYYKMKSEQAAERAAKFKKKSQNMSDFLKRKMIECNKKKVETPLLTASIKKKKQSVLIDETADLESPEDNDFVVTTVSRKWDKTKIKEKIDAGKQFKTVRLSDTDFTLSIK